MRIGLNVNWRLALLIIAITSMVSPYISQMYRGLVGLTLILIVLFFLIFSNPIGNYFKSIVVPSQRVNKSILISLSWFIVGIMVTYLRGADDISYLIQVLFIPIYFLLGLFLSQNKQYRSLAVLSIIAYCFINILFTGRDIGASVSARDIYIKSGEELITGTSWFWGLIGIFFPVFLSESIKQNKIIMLLFLPVLLLLLYKLLYSGFATPIALLLINLMVIGIIYLLFSIHGPSRLFRSLIIVFFFVGVGYLLLTSILNSESSGMSSVQGRFINFIENPIEGGYTEDSKYAVSRFKLIEFSWKTFLSNPLFGGGGNIRTSIYEGISGGHSSAVDFLAVLGLVGGGGAFIYFVWNSLRNSFQQLKRNKSFRDICSFATVITFIIGGVMNPYWQGPILASFLLVVNIYDVKVFQSDSLTIDE